MLKNISLDQKDPHYPWDYPEHKRNFNDVIHAENDLYGEERYSTVPPRYSVKQMYAAFFGVMGMWFFLYWWFEDKPMFRPAAPKQLHGDGKTRYGYYEPTH